MSCRLVSLFAPVLVSRMRCGSLLKHWLMSSAFLSTIPGMGLTVTGSTSPEKTQTCSHTFYSGKGISSNGCELSLVFYLHSEWMGTDTPFSQRKKALPWSKRSPALFHWEFIDRWMDRNYPRILCELNYVLLWYAYLAPLRCYYNMYH